MLIADCVRLRQVWCAGIACSYVQSVRKISLFVLIVQWCYVILYTLVENKKMLEKFGFYNKCGSQWLFPSIQEALNHALLGVKLVSTIIYVYTHM